MKNYVSLNSEVGNSLRCFKVGNKVVILSTPLQINSKIQTQTTYHSKYVIYNHRSPTQWQS